MNINKKLLLPSLAIVLSRLIMAQAGGEKYTWQNLPGAEQIILSKN